MVRSGLSNTHLVRAYDEGVGIDDCYLFVSTLEADDEGYDSRWPYGLWFQYGQCVARFGSFAYPTEEQARKEGRQLLAALAGQTDPV